MKNTSIISIVVLLCMAAMFFGCEDLFKSKGINWSRYGEIDMSRVGRFVDEGLSIETEIQILYTIAHEASTFSGRLYNVNHWYLFEYYGIYNDVVVFTILYEGPSMVVPNQMREDIISGFRFVYFGLFNKNILTWKGMEIFHLPEAYDLELLSREDIQNIHEKWATRHQNSIPGGIK